MKKEYERLYEICEILWVEKENWRTEIQNYLIDLSAVYERIIQLINIGEITDYTVDEITNQIEKLMLGIENKDNMFIADILIGETKKIFDSINNIEEK